MNTNNFKKIFIGATIVVFFVIVGMFTIHQKLYTGTSEQGFLVYAYDTESIVKGDKLANSVCVYDFNNNEELIYSVEGYKNIINVGQYVGGDFCCIGITTNNDNDILLFSGGRIIKSINVPMELLQVAAYDDIIYFIGDGALYSVEINSNNFNLISDCLYDYHFSISENGRLAFVENILLENGKIENMLLCVYFQGQKQYFEFGESSEYWISNSEIVSMAFLSKNDTFTNNKYIINVDTKEWEKNDLFEDVYGIATISPEYQKILYWSYSDEYLHVMDFTTKKNGIISLMDVDYSCMQKQFVWLVENPMG